MTWNILVLMAGDGCRFSTAGFLTPKPLIKTRGRTILEWTTRSLPFIKHEGQAAQELDYQITFAIRSQHDKDGQLSRYLKKTYGHNTIVKSFKSLTRGNLETALLSLNENFPNSPLLVLDADNKYNGSRFHKFISDIPDVTYASLCCFNPVEDSEKWCFAKITHEQKVTCLSEKKKIENGLPMVGVFFYSDKAIFEKVGKAILADGTRACGEFYMSQTINSLLLQNIPVYAHTTDGVDPLGTPEDLYEFENAYLL